MTNPLHVVRSELLLGGQKSGKSRRALELAMAWLQGAPGHRAVVLATAVARDAEMHTRILRHQRERLQLEPRLTTIEEPRDLAAAIAQHSRPDTLLVVDCLTLWLTNLLWPEGLPHDGVELPDVEPETERLLGALQHAPGPLVLVSNEIGLGVIPMGQSTRAFVDALGVLNQQVAGACQRVCFMAGGLPLVLKAPL